MTPIRTNAGISLRQRLLSLTLLTSGIGLLAGCGAFLAFDSYNAKNKTVRELRLTADLIGTNASAALAFDDALNGEKLLEKMGHHVTLACNGKQAVEHVERRTFDVVLMDIQMPIMGGVQAIQLIRKAELEANRRTPIVAMTAHAMKGDREKYLMAGLDGYVSKPIRTDVLRDEIARVVQFAEIRFQSNEGTPMEKQNSNSLDREELLNRVEHDEELAREILGIFQTDSAANRDSLRAAVESRNADEVRSLAHGFKGMLANLAANSASAAAGNLETLGKEGKANEFASAWQAFDNELSNVLKEVEQMLAGAIQ